MSSSSVIVSLVFEEMAEEENLFSSDRPAIIAGLYPIIDETQVKILEGTIISRAQRVNCSQFLLREAFLCAYRLDEINDLPRRSFEEALNFLSQFSGVN